MLSAGFPATVISALMGESGSRSMVASSAPGWPPAVVRYDPHGESTKPAGPAAFEAGVGAVARAAATLPPGRSRLPVSSTSICRSQ